MLRFENWRTLNGHAPSSNENQSVINEYWVGMLRF